MYSLWIFMSIHCDEYSLWWHVCQFIVSVWTYVILHKSARRTEPQRKSMSPVSGPVRVQLSHEPNQGVVKYPEPCITHWELHTPEDHFGKKNGTAGGGEYLFESRRFRESRGQKSYTSPSPPPRPDKTPNMTMKKYKTPIIKDSALCSEDDPVSRMFHTRPSLQDNSTLTRETRRNTITGRESSNERDSVIAKEVRYSKDKPHVRVDSVTSESTRYIEEILHSKRQKSKLVSRYIIVTFILTNLMLVGFSILGSMLIIPQINPCICPETSPRTEHHIQATQSPTGSESPVLSQSRPKTQTPDHGRNQDTETSQDKKHDNMDQDYSISYFIRVENKTHDDFWTD